MKIILKIYYIVSWAFCAYWLTYGAVEYGWEWIMPLWYKVPLLLSLFGPILVYLISSYITINRDNDDTDNR
jgi:uncharacterized membrane protein YhdT